MNQIRNVNALPPGTMLDRYRVLDVLGAGGFGITYLAEDASIGRKVAIKEYLPGELATRARDGNAVVPIDGGRAESFAWGLKRFIDEARTLARFEHPNIVTVFTYFEANGTAYYAMRYVEGEPLDRIVPLGITLGEEKLRALVDPLLSGLEAVHEAGFLHRDIKPANIFVRMDGAPVLIDFGAARHAIGEHSKTLTAVLSPGYAPFEQYHGDGNQGPWTDLYALGATLYRCVCGRTPPEATVRMNASARHRPDPMVPAAEAARGRYDPALLAAIDAALRVHEEDRPKSVAEFRALLRAAPQAEAAPTLAAPAKDAGGEQTLVGGYGTIGADAERTLGASPRRGNRRWALAAGVAVLLGAGAVWGFAEYRASLQQAERDAQQKAAEEAQKRAAEEAKRKAEEGTKRKPDEEATRKAEEDAKRRAEEEARRKAEEDRLRAEARLPQLCDRLAAPEFDPTNAGGVRGVALDKIDTARALTACREAIARFPRENRFKYYVARVHFAARRYAEALEIARPLAAAGDPAAEMVLWDAYERGLGVEKNQAEAIRLLRSAADRHFARAQYALGRAYWNGQSIAKDAAEAVRWFHKAAEQRFALAEYAMGLARLDGAGIEKSDTEAVRWFRAAADRGLPLAQYGLGTLYFQGRGVAQNDSEAARWFRSAAEQGYARGMHDLGAMYADGRGVAKDEVEAVRWFRLAAQQGDADGQFKLGLAYFQGRGGVAADREQAIAWFRRAAAQGNEQAKKALEQLGAR